MTSPVVAFFTSPDRTYSVIWPSVLRTSDDWLPGVSGETQLAQDPFDPLCVWRVPRPCSSRSSRDSVGVSCLDSSRAISPFSREWQCAYGPRGLAGLARPSPVGQSCAQPIPAPFWNL